MTRTVRSTTWILLALLALFAGVGLWFASRTDTAQADAGTTEERVTAVNEPVKPALSEVETSAREVVPASASLPSSPPQATTPLQPALRGRVLDLAGLPVAGVNLSIEGDEEHILTCSGPDGVFECAAVPDHGLLIGWSTTFMPVKGIPLPSATKEPFMVVAPAITVSGIVSDEARTGLDAVQLKMVLPERALVRFPHPLDALEQARWPVTLSEVGGTYVIPRAIGVTGAYLEASLVGFKPGMAGLPTASRGGVDIVMQRIVKNNERILRGTVVRADGTAANTASVHLDELHVSTNERGEFWLELPERLHDDTPLVATEGGSQGALIPRFGVIANAYDPNRQPVRLVLGPPSLSISGRVLKANGDPLVGWTVALVDGTRASTSGRFPPPTLESLTSTPPGPRGGAKTDAKGGFELGGLLSRDYKLCAYGSKPSGRIESGSIAAGSRDVELRLPADAFATNVTGRIVGRDGVGIGGVGVAIALVVASDRGSTSWNTEVPITTSADGSFRFEVMARRFVELRISGDAVIPRQHSLENVDLSRPIVIEAVRRCHFRVEGIPQGDSNHWLLAHDADGKELQIYKFERRNWSGSNRQLLTADATIVYAVSELAVDISLLQGGRDSIGTRPLKLVPGEVTVVQW